MGKGRDQAGIGQSTKKQLKEATKTTEREKVEFLGAERGG